MSAHRKTWLILWFLLSVAHAQGPRLGLEFEVEKDRRSGIRNHAVTLEPGWGVRKRAVH